MIGKPPVDDVHKARGYALRDLNTTDYLAFREVARSLPASPLDILDFGCGAGRSSRFLTQLGHRVTGVDANPHIVEEARSRNPSDYFKVIAKHEILPFADHSFDAFFSSWAFVEERDPDMIVGALKELRRVIKPGGTGIVIANTAEFYEYDWLSCNVNFPENAPPLLSGQRVVVRLLPENLVIHDYYWSGEDYLGFFAASGLSVLATTYPLGQRSDGIQWKDELEHPPFVIYRLSYY